MQIEMIKKTLLNRTNNNMTSYYKYLVYFRGYIDDRHYYKFKDIVTIFDDDIFEYLEKDNITKKELNNTISELAFCSVDTYSNMNASDIYKQCNEHIEKYNKTCY